VRLEERVLFPLIEESVDEERLAALRLPGGDAARAGAPTSPTWPPPGATAASSGRRGATT
jgi:hypothetical protein